MATSLERLPGETLLQALSRQFVAGGGKKLSEGGTAAQNIAVLNAIPGAGGFRPIGSLAGDIIRTAAPGILATTAAVTLGPIIAAKSGGEKMFEMMATAPATAPQGNTGLLNAIVGLAGTAIKAFAPQQTPAEKAMQKVLPTVGTFGQNPLAAQIQSGITQFAGKCKKPRYHAVAIRDGNVIRYEAVPYCPKRRMNPLNPKALGRAARRLGSFQRIAAHVEKTIQKSLRRSGVRHHRTSSRSTGACFKCGR